MNSFLLYTTKKIAIYQHAEDHRWHDEWQRLRY